jgi:hypothetical protein
VFGVLLTLLSISNWVEHGSLLTSSSVALYLVYLCQSGLSSEPESYGCNPYWNDSEATSIEIAIACALVLITVLYLSFKGKRDEINENSENTIRDIADPLLVVKGEDYDNAQNDEPDRGMIWFHLFMMLIAIYMSMMMTNWGTPNTG